MGDERPIEPPEPEAAVTLSREGARRTPGQLRSFVANFTGARGGACAVSRTWRRSGRLTGSSPRPAGLEGVIGMHGGLPPASAFPITGMTLTLADGSTLPITDPAALFAAQQYNLDPRGYPPLVRWAHARTLAEQRPARGDAATVLTSGASHSIDLVLGMLLNPGDALLVEEVLYSAAFEMTIVPRGYVPFGVALDSEGAGQGLGVEGWGQELGQLRCRHCRARRSTAQILQVQTLTPPAS